MSQRNPSLATDAEVSAVAAANATTLEVGTVTSTTVGITSDGSVDDVILPEATATEAGLLNAADKVKLNATSGTNTGDMTDADVKTAYENNADTNAFTDAEKTKVSNLSGTNTGDQVIPVDSVNTQTGAVVLDADDISDAATTNKFVTASDLTNLGNLSGTNTGDQDLSGYVQTTDIDTLAELNTVITDATLIDTTDARLSDSRTCDNTFDDAATARTNLGVDVAGTDNSTDEVEEYVNFAGFPGTGVAGVIYVDEATGDLYRWDGAAYTSIGGGNAPVDSVNTQTGAVVLDADDISDAATTNKFVTAGDLTNLGNLSGTNSGDEVSATTTVEGIAEIATQTEVNTGTDTTRFVTPDTLEDKTYGTFTGETIPDNSTLKAALQSLEVAAETGADGVGSILGSATGVVGTTTGNTAIFTIPVGEEAVVRQVIIRLKTIAGGGNVPKVSVGTNSPNFDNITINQSLSGLTSAGDGYTFAVVGVYHVGQPTEVLTLRVNNASSYTTYVFDVDLVGYTI